MLKYLTNFVYTLNHKNILLENKYFAGVACNIVLLDFHIRIYPFDVQ